MYMTMINKNDWKTNRQMNNMLLPAKEKLLQYTPLEICGKAGAVYNESEQLFYIKSFAGDLKIRYPEYDPEPEIKNVREMWYYLTMLQYLDTADGTPLLGKWITLSEMPGGAARSVGFQKETDHAFARAAHKAQKKEFLQACLEIGGVPAEGKGDVCCIVYFAPRFPVMINFWEADDEFPASVRMYVDARSEHYLTIEGAGTACGCVINKLTDLLL